MNGSFFSQIYTNGAILSIFFYFSTPFLYACVFGMGLFFSAREAWQGGYKGLSFPVKESAAAVIGLLAFRYGRRRGLRNSLRSNSILTPSPYGHSPCVSVGKYRGETEGTVVPEERG